MHGGAWLDPQQLRRVDQGRGVALKTAFLATLVVLLLAVTPASASAAWYLMAPPCAPTHVVTLNDGSKTLQPAACSPDDRTPLSKWESIGSFTTADMCDAQKLAVTTLRNRAYLQELDRTNNPADPTVLTFRREYDQMSYARCVASDDPKLK